MKDMNGHLKKIEDDQLLNGITLLDDTRRDDAGRHWAVSQMLQPAVIQGGYSAITGRYVLGCPSWTDNMTPGAAYTTASAASMTLTCATGHRYKVYAAGAMNATQASTHTLSGTISGNTISSLGLSSSSTAMNFFLSGAGTTTGFGSIHPIWLNAGDTLTITTNTYAAGNDTEHFFLYEDYTL